MKLKKILIISVIGTLCTFSVYAEEVEVTLKHNLDGYLNGYCLDIKGRGDIKAGDGVQAHTCYSYKGTLGDDQIFESKNFEKNQFYFPRFDLCVALSGLEKGAAVALATCDSENELQQLNFLESGNISPKNNQSLCLTASLDTTRGRGGTSDHQIKKLTLETCSSSREIFQKWRSRTKKD